MVHHGGAGTIAAGLQLGLPTMVVPFFGDQHLWGAQVARLGVGPPPVLMASLSNPDPNPNHNHNHNPNPNPDPNPP